MQVGRGPRAVEEALFARLATLAAEARTDPRLLARPVRLVVPSSVLAAHLGARITARLGVLLGVRVQTLFSLALDVLAAAGMPSPRGGAAFGLLVRRFAAATHRLGRELSPLEDGFGVVEGAVRDLLDAGFETAHLEAVDERLQALRGAGAATPAELERALELARLARATAEGMATYGLSRHADVYARAAEALAADAALLPSRAVLIHGFANATGLVLDLLAALTRVCDAELFLDLPPEPGQGAQADAGESFAARLASRLSGRTVAELASGARVASEASRWSFVTAAGPWAEARDAVRRARRWIETGIAPESIALVARDLERYRLPLRQAFHRLGVPYSAPRLAGISGARERRLAALVELLRAGARAPVDAWLEARAAAPSVDALELRIGLRALGAIRLADVAALELPTADLPLPIRRGEATAEADDGESDQEDVATKHQGLVRRRLRLATLAQAVGAARRVVGHFERVPGGGSGRAERRAPFGAHRAWLGQTLAALGWSDSGADASEGAEATLWLALGSLASEMPADFPLTSAEFARLAAGVIEELPPPPFGGRGGGVRVLSATEARGCTFERLVLLGLNRELFPRRIEEDPLLPDAVRRSLAGLLPDVPIKADGHAEERYLFAQLLASAPEITLSWCASDDDGNPATPSPLVESLRRALGVEAEVALPLAAAEPMAVVERATLAALAGGQAALEQVLAPALGAHLAAPSSAPSTSAVSASELARVRLAVLSELEPDRRAPAARRLSPLLGLCGRRPADRAAEPVFVTALENLARCSWRTLLERELRLALPPDPLADLAEIDGLLVGEVVHAYVEAVVESSGAARGGPLEPILAREGVPLVWPSGVDREALLARVAAGVTAAEGAPLLARPVAERSRAFLVRAERELAAASSATATLVHGAEAEGALVLETAAGDRRELRFRADLVERRDDTLVLTDLKTGRPSRVLEAKRAETRAARLLAEIHGGTRLQAMAYALAITGERARGRYLFLGSPEDDEAARGLELTTEDDALLAAFHSATTTLFAALDHGAYVPRLLDTSLEEEGPACRGCAVREACRQGDSVVTRRFARWVEHAREHGATGAAGAALAVLRLQEKPAASSSQAAERAR